MLDSLVRVSRRGKENHFVLLSQGPMLATEVNSLCALPRAATKHNSSRTQRPSRKRPGKYDQANTGFLRFPFSGFRYSLTLFSKFFASFPHGTCTLSVSHQYLALDGIYHPLRAAIPNNSTRRLATHPTGRTGVSPSQLSFSKELGPAGSVTVDRPQLGAKAQIHILSISRFTRRYWGNPG
jgi:hypothetical protein